MTRATAHQSTPCHAAFLRRLAAEPAAGSAARLGEAALLALRFVDLLDGARPVDREAFRYQHAATKHCCERLPGNRPETSHLAGIVASAAAAFFASDVRLVLPALLAYAHFLEDELRLEEARDVLETLLRVGGERIGAADRVAVLLRMARVLRKQSAFDDADRLYAQAGERAAAIGDGHSELVSRLGRALVMRGRGNLLDAETHLRAVLSVAGATGDRLAQAAAEHDLGVVLSARGQPADSVPHLWRAFELYDDESSRLRVLHDLGVMLLSIGEVESAERALLAVVGGGATRELRENACIELMDCASSRGDRVGFERWRERCERALDAMPPNLVADFHVRAGVGRARFGQIRRADALLRQAVAVGERAGLHELAFRAERIRAGLRDCVQELNTRACAGAERVVQPAAVQEVSASLARWAASPERQVFEPT